MLEHLSSRHDEGTDQGGPRTGSQSAGPLCRRTQDHHRLVDERTLTTAEGFCAEPGPHAPFVHPRPTDHEEDSVLLCVLKVNAGTDHQSEPDGTGTRAMSPTWWSYCHLQDKPPSRTTGPVCPAEPAPGTSRSSQDQSPSRFWMLSRPLSSPREKRVQERHTVLSLSNQP